MPKLIRDVQTFVSQTLHNFIFLEEFVFARNKFKLPSSGELELADAVVMIGDVLLIYQIKERKIDHRVDPAAECRWFSSKVLGKATKQIRDTLGYLKAYSEILVPNERGHTFNLAASSFKEVIKIVVYAPSSHLPDKCSKIRHHISGSAGFIHVIDAHDYLELSHMLRVPEEIIQYFKFRERLLTKFPYECARLPESALAGHYIVADSGTVPTVESAIRLRKLVRDSAAWDLAPLLRGLHDHLSDRQVNTEYYDILLEFMKLPRSAWRIVKERLILCHEKARRDEFARPYRMVVPETGCGFVFVPIQSEFVQAPDWQTIRVRAIENMARLHKYDQRLFKCIGFLIGKDGDYFDTNWCLLKYDWTEEPELQQALEESSPFRPVNEHVVYSYYLQEGAMKSNI